MEDRQVQAGDGTDETNAKNLQTTFDGGLGDDFLLCWKPSKINSTVEFDIDDGLPPVPNKKLKMPDDFNSDIDMPNFDPGLTSKLSSFDVDLEFFESSDKEGSRDENGGSQTTQFQISQDQKLIILSDSEELSSPSEQEKDSVLKSADFENKSSSTSQDQHVNRSEAVDFDKVSSCKSQEESRSSAHTIGHNSDTSLVKRREALITERADEHVTLTTLPVESIVEVATPARKVTLPRNLSNQVSSLHEKCEWAPPEKEHHSVRADEIRNGTEISDLQLSKEQNRREIHSSKDAACIPMSVDVQNGKQSPFPMKDLGLRVQPVHSPRELKSSRQTRITAKQSSSEQPLHSHGSSTAVRALIFENDRPSILTDKEGEVHQLFRKRTSMSPTFPIAEGEGHDPSTSLESLIPVQVDSTMNTSKLQPLPFSTEEQRTGALSSKAVHQKVQKPAATTRIDKVDSFQDIKSSASRAKGNRAPGYTWNITS